MASFNEICAKILEELESKKPGSKREFNQIKLDVIGRYSSMLGRIPKNADLYFAASDEQREKYKGILSLKPVRTLSGVAPIALMSDPYPCPHTMKGIGPCTYCPGGPGSPFGDVPQSYTGKEPSTRRSIRNHYDPYLVVFNRLEHYVAMNRVPDKAEIIIQGGTFTFFPKAYQEYFVKYALKAMNDFSRLFFCPDGSIGMEKFKRFFELGDFNDKDPSRTERVQGKLRYIKNKDLSNNEKLNKINKLIESDDFNNFDGNNKISLNNDYDNTRINDNSNNEDSKNNIRFLVGGKTNANVAAIKNIQKKLEIENNREFSLQEIQKQNETSFIRCVGMTIETKSDFGKIYHGNLMLELGCTRVEIGIQSVYNDVLEATNRGNSVEDNIESIRILKDLGLKINAHYMPGLPLTTREMDRKGMRQLFDNPYYRPDMLKLYPCMVMEGTRLHDDWKNGKFSPLTTEEAAELIADFKQHVPKYCRIMRVQRDIPTYATASGVDRTNFRQYVEQICREKGIRCRCIRCREAGQFESATGKKIDLEEIKIVVEEYDASNGKEFFISAEDLGNDALAGFVRLRFPSQFLRPEITESSALVRELHVFSAAVQIGKDSDDSLQHKGIGRALMKKAEEIAGQGGKDKIVVISGIGAREYFRKLGYEREGAYMVKNM
ncbi:tRNA uridine(34) 5-carboxymethylaminomethyl modification radical SAM/GNAT enzyme Elp3 [Candidatus Woesearchaeota archaeon]|nr:tRNA uridine(34) 5-carboxymethylaminomethyl modification radical SAM/GNAT enzyme Elp3 [Candidatus Woesearchaeota archaeon]